MTTFAAALSAAWEKKVPGVRPYASEAVAAVLLDRAGVSVEDVEQGRVIVGAGGDNDLHDAVKWIGQRIWQDHYIFVLSVPNMPQKDREHAVVYADIDDVVGPQDWQQAVGEMGLGLIVVVKRADDVHPAIGSWATTKVTLDRVDADGVIPSVVQLVTGQRPTLKSSMKDVTLADIRTALGPRDPAQAAVAMMTILRDLRGRDYDKLMAKRRQEIADANPTEKGQGSITEFMDGLLDGRPAHERDTPLSQMSGFGPAKAWGLEVAADLTAYRQGELPWADVDRGVLLSGPPGVGKTRFARALAAEAGVSFHPSSFSQLCQGGASGSMVEKALKKLFDEARKHAPAIVFLDEMDSVPSREGAIDHNTSYFTAVMNSFLEALDGAVPRDGVVVIAATNHADKIDPALRRPGRLDRHIEIPMPTVDDLCGIIRHHLGTNCDGMEDQVRLAARACRGMSPADVEQICRDARRRARRDLGRKRALPGDIVFVLEMRRPDRTVTEERLVALHEAGHAVAAVVVGFGLESVDIDRQQTAGKRPGFLTADDMRRELRIMLAGRAAEEVILGRASTGARVDLTQATRAVMSFHAEYGFGDVAGLMAIDTKLLADGGMLMGTIRSHLDRAWDETLALVRLHRDNVERVAAALQWYRYLDGAEVQALMRSPSSCPGPPARRRAGPDSLPGAEPRSGRLKRCNEYQVNSG